MNVKKIALFASGNGTNAQNIIEYFADREHIKIDSLWSNNPHALALSKAEKQDIKTFVFNREQFYTTGEVIEKLEKRKIDLIVLAGFLWLIPEKLIKKFTIINIHPALLPKYGGKGMYGMNVHRAVIEAKEKESGATIHFVDNGIDTGEIIMNVKVPVLEDDTPETLQKRILEKEHILMIEGIKKLLKA